MELIEPAASIISDACRVSKQELIILPTEKCNFRCSYCYESFQLGRMSERTQGALERFLDVRVPELRHLVLKWFGGEPLVAKDVVFRISEYAKRLCDEHGVSLVGGLTTNAWFLDDETLLRLLRSDQRHFQITLDGFGEKHDSTRKLKGGGGTFERIWKNLLTAREQELSFHIQLRIHVRRDNERDLKDLLSNIAEYFGGDSRYSLDFEHLRNLGGAGGQTVADPLSVEELLDMARELGAHYHRESVRFHGARLSASGADVTTAGAVLDQVCYASKPNSLLIRANGRIGKCTVALYDERNDIGTILDDGRVAILPDKLRPWIRGVQTLDLKELACPLSGM